MFLNSLVIKDNHKFTNQNPELKKEVFTDTIQISNQKVEIDNIHPPPKK